MTQEIELRGRHTAAVVAAACAWQEAQGGVGHAIAYRQLLQLGNDLAAISDEARRILTADEPEASVGRWKDAVAALIEHRFTESDTPLPEWVKACEGQSDSPWEPQRHEMPIPFPVDLEEVSEPFLRRGILIEVNELD